LTRPVGTNAYAPVPAWPPLAQARPHALPRALIRWPVRVAVEAFAPPRHSATACDLLATHCDGAPATSLAPRPFNGGLRSRTSRRRTDR
jgi:hypothetical protein